jgi:hypothetical protein
MFTHRTTGLPVPYHIPGVTNLYFTFVPPPVIERRRQEERACPRGRDAVGFHLNGCTLSGGSSFDFYFDRLRKRQDELRRAGYTETYRDATVRALIELCYKTMNSNA